MIIIPYQSRVEDRGRHLYIRSNTYNPITGEDVIKTPGYQEVAREIFPRRARQTIDNEAGYQWRRHW